MKWNARCAEPAQSSARRVGGPIAHTSLTVQHAVLPLRVRHPSGAGVVDGRATAASPGRPVQREGRGDDARRPLGPGGEALVDPKPPTPGLDRWTARPPIPDVLPGEDRTFGDGLFVDLIPRTDDPVRMRDAVEGVGAVGVAAKLSVVSVDRRPRTGPRTADRAYLWCPLRRLFVRRCAWSLAVWAPASRLRIRRLGVRVPSGAQRVSDQQVCATVWITENLHNTPLAP